MFSIYSAIVSSTNCSPKDAQWVCYILPLGRNGNSTALSASDMFQKVFPFPDRRHHGDHYITGRAKVRVVRNSINGDRVPLRNPGNYEGVDIVISITESCKRRICLQQQSAGYDYNNMGIDSADAAKC